MTKRINSISDSAPQVRTQNDVRFTRACHKIIGRISSTFIVLPGEKHLSHARR